MHEHAFMHVAIPTHTHVHHAGHALLGSSPCITFQPSWGIPLTLVVSIMYSYSVDVAPMHTLWTTLNLVSLICPTGGVPMQWMGRLHAPHAIFFERARGNRITDVDGNEMLDFCLGDTGAMAGM